MNAATPEKSSAAKAKVGVSHSVLLVDDHKILRDGIRSILSRHPEFTVVGDAATGTEAVQECKHMLPDIVLMDIGLPGMNGIEATVEVLRHCPGVRVIILSMYDDEQLVVNAIQSGASAFVLKSASDSSLLVALQTVAGGGSYFSPQVSDRILDRIRNGEQKRKPSTLDELSPRELQVLRLVAQGRSSKEIAEMLILGLQTVRSYRKTMMKKLNINNIAGLTQFALAAGLTHLASDDARAARVAAGSP